MVRRLDRNPNAVYYAIDLRDELLADAIQHGKVVVSSFDERESVIRCEYAWVEGEHVDPARLPVRILLES
jgi:hypothetical protein